MPQEPRTTEERLQGLEARLDHLERVVKDFINAMRRREAPTAPPPAPRSALTQRSAPPRPRPMPTSSRPAAREQLTADPIRRAFEGKGSAYWLSRAGIGLLLLGVAFLFKYAVDQGWLTPTIRVGFGLALGSTLAAVGLRVRDRRRWFGALTLGGASATFYITGYAAFQMFHLVSYATAMGFMIAVTVYTWWAGWTIDEASLGVLGVLGGLGTPFILYTSAGSVAGLAGYESAVLVGAAGIYLRKGWRSLLWTTVVGGWSVLVVGLVTLLNLVAGSRTDQWVLQLAVVIAVLAFWSVPVLREQLAPTDGPEPQALALTTPLGALYFTYAIWAPPDTIRAAIAAGGAVVWAATWWYLRSRKAATTLASMHAVAAAVLVAIALQHLFASHTLLVTWAVEVAALLWLARRTGDRHIRATAHLLGAVVGIWLALRLGGDALIGVSVSHAAVADALVIGLAAAGAYSLEGTELRWYRVVIFTALALWLRREILTLPRGDALLLIVWAAVGGAAIRLARLWREPALERFAHVLFAATALWLGNRLIGGEASGVAALNLRALLYLLTLGTALVAARGLTDRDAAAIYAVIVHVLFLGWLWHELSRLPTGQAWVSTSWGVYGIILLVVGLRLDHTGLRKAALATFAAVVVKLFIVDLSELEPIWRILLFLGFGGAFLALSYLFPSLWKMKKSNETSRD